MEQRRKETLSQTGEDGSAVGEGSLQQLIARYRFLDLWPCSTFDLDHITHQQVLLAMMNPVGICRSFFLFTLGIDLLGCFKPLLFLWWSCLKWYLSVCPWLFLSLWALQSVEETWAQSYSKLIVSSRKVWHIQAKYYKSQVDVQEMPYRWWYRSLMLVKLMGNIHPVSHLDDCAEVTHEGGEGFWWEQCYTRRSRHR